MRVRARITDPAPGATIAAGTYTVRGKAWSGAGPITQVEISLTGEGEWHPAQVDPPKGPYQWQDWSFAWEATDVGRHTLRARATDAAGNVQPDVPPWNRLGYGNNAVEVLYVDVGLTANRRGVRTITSCAPCPADRPRVEPLRAADSPARMLD